MLTGHATLRRDAEPGLANKLADLSFSSGDGRRTSGRYDGADAAPHERRDASAYHAAGGPGGAIPYGAAHGRSPFYAGTADNVRSAGYGLGHAGADGGERYAGGAAAAAGRGPHRYNTGAAAAYDARYGSSNGYGRQPSGDWDAPARRTSGAANGDGGASYHAHGRPAAPPPAAFMHGGMGPGIFSMPPPPPPPRRGEGVARQPSGAAAAGTLPAPPPARGHSLLHGDAPAPTRASDLVDGYGSVGAMAPPPPPPRRAGSSHVGQQQPAAVAAPLAAVQTQQRAAAAGKQVQRSALVAAPEPPAAVAAVTAMPAAPAAPAIDAPKNEYAERLAQAAQARAARAKSSLLTSSLLGDAGGSGAPAAAAAITGGGERVQRSPAPVVDGGGAFVKPERAPERPHLALQARSALAGDAPGGEAGRTPAAMAEPAPPKLQLQPRTKPLPASPPHSAGESGRPCLNLLPRSKPAAEPVAAVAPAAAAEAQAAPPRRTSVFGAARPREEVLKERGVEVGSMDSHASQRSGRSGGSAEEQEAWQTVGARSARGGGGGRAHDGEPFGLGDSPFFDSGAQPIPQRYGNGGGGYEGAGQRHGASRSYGSPASGGFGRRYGDWGDVVASAGGGAGIDEEPIFKRSLPVRQSVF